MDTSVAQITKLFDVHWFQSSKLQGKKLEVAAPTSSFLFSENLHLKAIWNLTDSLVFFRYLELVGGQSSMSNDENLSEAAWSTGLNLAICDCTDTDVLKTPAYKQRQDLKFKLSK